MRNFQRVLCGLGLFGAAAVAGCSGEDAKGEAVGESEARIVLVAEGSESASMHLTATNNATAEVAIDKTVTVDADGSAVLDLSLVSASYTLHLDAFADDSHTTLLSSGDAHLDLSNDVSTEIFLTAHTDGDATGSTGIDVSINGMPHIDGITVTHKKGSVTIDVDVAASNALNFFWSGYGIDGAVKGSSSLTISAEDGLASGGEARSHLVIQTSAGATASFNIDLTATVNGVACVFCDSDTRVDVDVSGDSDLTIQACLEGRIQCDLACKGELELDPLDVQAALSCISNCGFELASCEAGVN